MPELSVFPRVKKAAFVEGSLPVLKGFTLKGANFEQLDPKAVRGLIIREDGQPLVMGVEEMPDENYRLHIGQDGVTLTAADERGALQGLRTVSYLASQGPLTFGDIEDGPDLQIRAYHLDLKDQFPNRTYIYELIDRLASMRYNTLVIEYEDKFPYSESLRPLPAEYLPKEDIQHITEWCRHRGIEVIPLIQSLGHLEFMIPYHPEVAETGAMVCPLKPESAALINRMVDEILELHSGARYIHIGGDEAWDLGTCHDCADSAEKDGKGALYGRHMERVIEHVLSKGVRPMIWADMALSHFDALDFIDSATVMVDWDYWSYGEKVDMVTIWGAGRTPNEKWSSAPVEKQEQFGEILEPGMSGCWSEGFAFTEYLREKGYDVVTASAVRSSGDPYTHPDHKYHLPNVWAAARTAFEDGALGSLVTSWAVRRTLPELTMMGLAAAAEAMWQAKIANVHWVVDFPARYGEIFLGDRSAGMAEYEMSVQGMGYDETFAGKAEGGLGEWQPKPRPYRIKQRVAAYPELNAGEMSRRIAQLDRGALALARVKPSKSGAEHVALYGFAGEEALVKLWIFRVLARLEKAPTDEKALEMARDCRAKLMQLKERARVLWQPYLSPGALAAEIAYRFDDEELLLGKVLKGT